MDTPITGTSSVAQTTPIPRLQGDGLVTHRKLNPLIDMMNTHGDSGALGEFGNSHARPLAIYKFSTPVADQIGVWNAKLLVKPKMNVVADLTEEDLGSTVIADDNLIVWVKEEIEEGVRMVEGQDIGLGWAIGVDYVTKKPVIIHVSGGEGGKLFGVRLSEPDGFEGDRDNPAEFTYTVHKLDNTTLLGTEVPLIRPRPNGKMIAGTTYGIAFRDAGVLKLWDAGEIEDTTGCEGEV